MFVNNCGIFVERCCCWVFRMYIFDTLKPLKPQDNNYFGKNIVYLISLFVSLTDCWCGWDKRGWSSDAICPSPLPGFGFGYAQADVHSPPGLLRWGRGGWGRHGRHSPHLHRASLEVKPGFSYRLCALYPLLSFGSTTQTFPSLSSRLIVYPPPPAKGGISVTNEDLHCLNNGEFLNDVIIDFYLKLVKLLFFVPYLLILDFNNQWLSRLGVKLQSWRAAVSAGFRVVLGTLGSFESLIG